MRERTTSIHPAEQQLAVEVMLEQFCRDLNSAHDEILRLQGVAPGDFSKFDWPEWSGPANSIRWAEKTLSKPLSKTRLREIQP